MTRKALAKADGKDFSKYASQVTKKVEVEKQPIKRPSKKK